MIRRSSSLASFLQVLPMREIQLGFLTLLLLPFQDLLFLFSDPLPPFLIPLSFP